MTSRFKYSTAAALGMAFMLAGCATSETGRSGDLAGVLGGVLSEPAAPSVPAALTTAEIEAGLREALTVGTQRVAAQLGRTNGYFGDPRVRIALPGALADMQASLAPLGLAGPLDDIELRLNRAAEAAMPQARDLVIEAVRSITLEDALSILNGGDRAATDYLRARTETRLEAALTPHMQAALEGAGAYAAVDEVARTNGLGAITASLREDLTRRAVGAGLDGLFLYLAAEERRIREQPVARTSEILRRVFGSVS